MKENARFTTEHEFDSSECRHYFNGQLSVLHCHHYAALYTQLASDVGFLDGKRLLAECAEDSFYSMLQSYFAKFPEISLNDMFDLGSQYYSAAGLGKMEVKYAGADSGEILLSSSHIDMGWLTRMGGLHDKPVNYITCGYIAALFSSAYKLPTRCYEVEEIGSIVSGAEYSHFKIVRR